ncbi:hypothetical protein DVH05_014461 [Phytophthora capsici]|nr:hypothetical protein DVH05_014461 [Phytophthora capsici]
MEELAAYGSLASPTSNGRRAPEQSELHGITTGPAVAASVEDAQEEARQHAESSDEASEAHNVDELGDSDELDDSGDEDFTPTRRRPATKTNR